MTALRPQLQVIAERHYKLSEDAHKRLNALSDAQLRWTFDDRWPILQIVDHLNRVLGATTPSFERAIAEAPPAGDEVNVNVPYSFTDRLFVRMLGPEAKIKLPVPKIFEPTLPEGPGAAEVQKLHAQFDALAIVLQSADRKQLKDIHVPSPASSAVRPSIVAYLDATVQHNRYHWRQIEALLSDSRFPSA